MSPENLNQDRTEAEPPLYDVITLMGGGSIVRLVHRGEVYVLRVTRMGKLILTK
ncbi:hemin uptake protein HemP [Tabrizicola sp. M-4]|uniref:hemin uptake protein HemP n=1 Tax=Tabrizicola sp. M-4 TaxID=3055847 RepID=UPI003DA815AF